MITMATNLNLSLNLLPPPYPAQMSSTFTPSSAVDMSKERDWQSSLGMLDWDNTSIVFTKRSLIEFLKYTGTTVDTNFSNINKLPRYAKFGKLTENLEAASNVEETDSKNVPARADGFIPSRRVRTGPGGPHTDIFAEGDEGDALAQAPPRSNTAQAPQSESQTSSEARHTEEADESGIAFPSSNIKPTRRVRENPGGNSSLSNFWDAEDQSAFKPTRRVRQGPGGHDSINDIF